jgi:hypothetical protein
MIAAFAILFLLLALVWALLVVFATGMASSPTRLTWQSFVIPTVLALLSALCFWDWLG